MTNGTNNLSWYQKPVKAETYRVNEFCCCLGSLKSGALIIGVIFTILSLLAVSVSFSYRPSLEESTSEATHGQYGYELGIYGIHTLITIAKASSILWLIVNLALLYGTINEQVEFVTPWVVWHLVLLFLQVIIAAWCGDIITSTISAYALELGTLILTAVLSEVLLIYFFIVVNSFRQNLKTEATEYTRLKSTTSL
ncbi:uncharacterized protein LOC110840281 [Zootermopsis nevadensis]|uniref:uncharacterized protein LOC110840281 n=1 Tax=Zootermopsis nevadensis TaxID=136037 RepID=UPI000B8E65F0|nr:uncharacterized protein LOC110840281 [Zootermopsis nevadensis]